MPTDAAQTSKAQAVTVKAKAKAKGSSGGSFSLLSSKTLLFSAAIALALALFAFPDQSPLSLRRKRAPTTFTPVTRDYYWVVTNFTAAPDGVSRTVLGINNTLGSANCIEANMGDRIRVHVKNGLNVPTSIHWHGMFQNGSNIMDGPSGVAQCPIPAGSSFVYDFVVNQSGSYWWHSHYRAQYVDGLRGPMIIHGPQDHTKYSYAAEQTIQLADWYHYVSEDLLAGYLFPGSDGAEPVPDSILINGKGIYNCANADRTQKCQTQNPTTAMARFVVQPSTTYRFRLISTSAFTAYNFSIDGHQLSIIETDGVDTIPYLVDRITINNGQRYSVLVTTSAKGPSAYIRVNALYDVPWTASPNSVGYNTQVTAILQYAGQPVPPLPTTVMPKKFVDFNQMLVKSWPPAAAPSKVDHNVPISFYFDTVAPDTIQRAYVSFNYDTSNAHTFQKPTPAILYSLLHDNVNPANLSPNLNIVQLAAGESVQLQIINYDGGEHPWHLHGHTFWIMGQGQANDTSKIPTTFPATQANPPRRDVITLAPCQLTDTGDCAPNSFGYTVLRFVADNPGVWFFHCHIEWHVEAGLDMVFVEALPQLKKAQGNLPASYTSMCA
ncbi:Cupredoxin [Geranomyces variabilis]|nr:Cupredoxin [Geranomyces variabilis]KAJ3141119.1 ferroxidase fet3 [Geranomyces variabilis]